MIFFCVIILSYITGSIPASIIAGRIFTKVDIREHGSKNPGASNVFRVAGPIPGILVAFFDIFKGFFSAYFIAQLAFGSIYMKPETISLAAGIAAVAGHVWSCFLKFRGGKGVATAIGIFLAVEPTYIAISCVIYIIMALVTRISSIASISAILSFPLIMTIMRQPAFDKIFYFSLIIAGLILFTHRENIIRIINKKENQL